MTMAALSPARKAAFDMLLAVERGHAHSDELLRAKRVDALSAPDRNLATTLVLGVLRWQMRLDEAIRSHLAKPDAKLDAEARIALRLGVFQLLFLERIPAHAAIDESVELTKRAGHRFAAGMVNAVLRQISRSELSEHRLDEASAVRTHPAWMVERWERCYGADAAGAICAHGQRQPRLSLRLMDAGVEGELAAAGIRLAPGELLAAARTVLAGDATATPAVREGRARIQDEGSQLVGEMAACPVPKAGPRRMRILDACAAPGGKTLILAERQPEARIVACEASPQRLAALQKRVAALGGRIECRLADAAAPMEPAVFDLALADVPCSGTGTLGRNPEIRYRLSAEDLPRQAERQRAILRAALNAARPGGRVVYSTCSLEPEENEQVVAAALAENANVRQVPAAEALRALRSQGILTDAGAERLAPCVTPQGALRLLPGLFGTDGFFVAVLERSG
ncbi:MAG: transcription antitermination factor NusB [Acidobacteriota bacterium]